MGKKPVIFGANWCPHTQNAVAAAGGSFVKDKASGKNGRMNAPPGIGYVDCAAKANSKHCEALGIKGYPTFMSCDTNTHSCTKVADGDIQGSFHITPHDL
eukprot:TRINITY_DN873_c0_g1_i1.p2 TRINITY_DN873_c0_g1~~TRINITY_DN873_c0_g1_i1.p2  ORF type:complete len:100 (+),score=40.41 TRINITY_DN873_c0_g1_i1:86-385(+)